MQTFEDAVRAARDAKASIEALTKAESLEREKLAALRVDFVREEQALVDSVAASQKQAQEAREALQAALVRINDAPLNAAIAAGDAQIEQRAEPDALHPMAGSCEDELTGEDAGFEPMTDQGQTLRDGVSLY
jgi:hypothetical protein